jgi:hypothetical protein
VGFCHAGPDLCCLLRILNLPRVQDNDNDLESRGWKTTYLHDLRFVVVDLYCIPVAVLLHKFQLNDWPN